MPSSSPIRLIAKLEELRRSMEVTQIASPHADDHRLTTLARSYYDELDRLTNSLPYGSEVTSALAPVFSLLKEIESGRGQPASKPIRLDQAVAQAVAKLRALPSASRKVTAADFKRLGTEVGKVLASLEVTSSDDSASKKTFAQEAEAMRFVTEARKHASEGYWATVAVVHQLNNVSLKPIWTNQLLACQAEFAALIRNLDKIIR